MNKILNFNEEAEKKEPLIWRCDCGNCAFMIYENGDLECTDCGALQNGVTEHYMTIRKWTRKSEEK